MRITKHTILNLVEQGDSETIFRALSSLGRECRTKESLLQQQADLAANLRQTFMETELDRDRLRHLCLKLVELCRVNELSNQSEDIVGQYGGLDVRSVTPSKR